MHAKLAGRLSLQDMVNASLAQASEKLASAPQPEVEQVEETVIDATDLEQVEKLASALEWASEELLKEADSIENGGESKQGGEQLPTNTPTGGRQQNKPDKARHQVPTGTGLKATKDNPGAATAVPTDDERAPGGNGAKYPEKGPLKTAAASVRELIAARLEQEKTASLKDTVKAHATKAYDAAKKGGKRAGNLLAGGKKHFSGKKDQGRSGNHLIRSIKAGGHQRKEALKSTAARAGAAAAVGGAAYAGKKKAAQAILDKVAEFQGGGVVLTDDKAGNNPKQPSAPARNVLQSNQGPIGFKKVDGKKDQKRQLSQVLTEPAQTKSTDSKVHENLRNASKGGVKIAAARLAALQKIASEGCTCGDKGECQCCKLKAAVAQKTSSNQ